MKGVYPMTDSACLAQSRDALVGLCRKLERERTEMLVALSQVSFYARINHGTKCKDYGEVVDPVLRRLGMKTGELRPVKA